MKLAIAVVLASTAAAHAEPSEVFATQPLALVARGVGVSYERQVAPRLSAVGLFGFRSAAEGDYGSTTFTLGAEARGWFRAGMRGPYVGLHASGGYTRLSDDQMGYIGASVGLAERVDFGWRFVVRDHFAIAPSIGIGAREDVDPSGRLATTVRGAVEIGLEIGWMR